MYVLVALPIPARIQDQISLLQQSQIFKKHLRSPRMEAHITLKAPQDIRPEQLNEWVREAETAIKTGAITIESDGLSFITTGTLAISIKNNPGLDTLHSRLADKLSRFNSPGISIHEGDQFSPHISIGKAGNLLPPAVRKEIIESLQMPSIRFESKIVRLYAREAAGYRPVKDIFTGSS